jgi:hypothetical protein
MSRYPFSDRIEEYISSGVVSFGNEKSVEAARRHLRSIGRILHQLKTEGIINSDNPSMLTMNDIQSFADRRKSDGASDSTIRRDLDYLNGYLLYLDNDSATVFQEDREEQRRELDEQSSLIALKRIMDASAKPDRMNWEAVRAFSFVILITVLGVRPEQLRRSYYVPGQYAGCLMDHFIDYIDESGKTIRRKLDLDRMPVVERYIKNPPLDLKVHSLSKRPFFPSGNPLFDFASPEDIRNMKRLVEKHIDQRFDYRICQRLYRRMKAADEEPQYNQQYLPPFYYPPTCKKAGIISRVGNLFR